MKRLLSTAAFSLMAVLMLVSAAWAQGQQNVTVSMEDNYFDQAEITVPAGTTVTWLQNGNNPHTTTSYDGLWDSGLIEGGTGETFSFTFDEPGTYTYFCGPHEDQCMVGTVTVTGGGAATEQVPSTGGPSLVAPALGLLLVASGIVGLVVRRRVS